jgi:DNA (cytosine-5)-methyltransferase 1
VARGQNKPIYVDMNLYQEIIFLMFNFDGEWVVENVVGYYEPLIKPHQYKAHYYWSSFKIIGSKEGYRGNDAVNEELEDIKGFDLSIYDGVDKKKILRNCVEPEAGLYIFNCAFKTKQETLL